MDSFDSSDNLGQTVGSVLGLGTSAFVAGCSEAVTQDNSGSGFVEMGEETSAGTDSVMDAGGGNPLPVTTVFGLLSLFSGSSSEDPADTVIIFRKENKKVFSSVERKAKEIYDNYNKTHIKEKTEGTSLITENSEVASVVNDIISNSKTKYELISGLECIEVMIKEGNQEEQGKQKRKL